jgi:hypothetical protein
VVSLGFGLFLIFIDTCGKFRAELQVLTVWQSLEMLNYMATPDVFGGLVWFWNG